jgi:hypothetical protein
MLIKQLIRLPKIVLALFIQLIVLLVLTLGVTLAPKVVTPPYSYSLLVLIQALLAAMISCRLGLPCWWRWIQFFIPIGLYVGLLVEFNPLWALGIFALVWLVFSNALTERVPLYLTNSTTRKALKKFIKPQVNQTFLDLGCGLGGNVVFMAGQLNISESHGVETAPIPYLFSKIYTRLRGGRTYAMDMWKTELSYYDIVYAFLSPEPMPKLWQKIKEEMQPGSVFISNSFAIPEITPTEIWELSDRRQTTLYIYRL